MGMSFKYISLFSLLLAGVMAINPLQAAHPEEGVAAAFAMRAAPILEHDDNITKHILVYLDDASLARLNLVSKKVHKNAMEVQFERHMDPFNSIRLSGQGFLARNLGMVQAKWDVAGESVMAKESILYDFMRRISTGAQRQVRSEYALRNKEERRRKARKARLTPNAPLFLW